MKELREKFPEGTLLFPMTSVNPPISIQIVRRVVNGGSGTFFKVLEEYGIQETVEDTIMFQVKNRPGGENDKVIFHGEKMWVELFSNSFDRSTGYDSYPLEDIDTLDKNVS